VRSKTLGHFWFEVKIVGEFRIVMHMTYVIISQHASNSHAI
jgi:hypothetical protein